MRAKSKDLRWRTIVRGGTLLSFAYAALVGCNAISGIGDFEATTTSLVEPDGDTVPDDPSTDDASTVVPPEEDATSPPISDDAGSIDPDPNDADPDDTGTPVVQDSGPVDSGPPLKDKRVFVTTGELTGNMGGIAGADALCAQAAEQAHLGGVWVAWLSTYQKEAIDRITYGGRYVRLDGAEVVANKQQLASSDLTSPISLTESKKPFGETTGNQCIWTGTDATSDAGAGSACSNWTSNFFLDFGSRGSATTVKSPEWKHTAGFSNGGWGCQVACSLFCFEL